MLQLIQEYKAAIRFQCPDNSGRHLQLVTSAHTVPGLTLVGQLPILHGEAGEGQLRALQEVGLLLAYRLQLSCQAGVLAAVLLGLGLCPCLVLVGADLGVDRLNIPDTGL